MYGHDVDLAHELAAARRCVAAMRASPRTARARRVALQDGGELFHERVVAQLEAAHLVGVAVVGDHRGDRGEQAHGGRDQRLGDAGRDHRERRLLHVTERHERTHDAPHRAEQAHVRAGRADGREHREALLRGVDLLAAGATRMARRAPSSNCAGGMPPCCAGARTRGSPTRRCSPCRVAPPRLSICAIQRRRSPPDQKLLSKRLGLVVRARQQRALAEDDGPGHQRGEQQQRHDDLHDEARVEHQLQDREFIVPSSSFTALLRSELAASGRGRKVFASRQATRTSPSAQQLVAVAAIDLLRERGSTRAPSRDGHAGHGSSSSSRAGLR